jgi:hypothetical protein
VVRGEGGDLQDEEDDMASKTRHDRRLERLLQFDPCPECTFDLVTGEGERSCHYYTCPNLPEELDVRCPRCFFNFMARDTTPGCGERPSCDFAVHEAPQRVANLTAWQAHHGLPRSPA